MPLQTAAKLYGLTVKELSPNRACLEKSSEFQLLFQQRVQTLVHQADEKPSAAPSKSDRIALCIPLADQDGRSVPSVDTVQVIWKRKSGKVLAVSERQRSSAEESKADEVLRGIIVDWKDSFGFIQTEDSRREPIFVGAQELVRAAGAPKGEKGLQVEFRVALDDLNRTCARDIKVLEPGTITLPEGQFEWRFGR